MTTTTSPSPSSHEGVPLPRLSDEAAAEIYLYVEHLFLIIESRYGHQIRRHFGEFEHPNLAGPDFDTPPDDPPF